MNNGGAVWLGMHGAQWLSVCGALFALALLFDSFLGHYRSGFAVRMQYSPFIVGAALVIAFIIAAVAPRAPWTALLLRTTAWASALLGVVGFGYHYFYGIVEKPGGHRWLLHHMMYHAPLLAPLGLTVVGAIALACAASLTGSRVLGRFDPTSVVTFVVAVSLVGLMLQVSVLHYRGAFNNRLMYAPLIIPWAAVAGAIWFQVGGTAAAERVYTASLWATFLLGFVGIGMHLRGLDRMMAGLFVALPNAMEGPPSVAPLLFSLVSLQGLIGVKLL